MKILFISILVFCSGMTTLACKYRIEKYALANLDLSSSLTKAVELGYEYSFTLRDSSISGGELPTQYR